MKGVDIIFLAWLIGSVGCGAAGSKAGDISGLGGTGGAGQPSSPAGTSGAGGVTAGSGGVTGTASAGRGVSTTGGGTGGVAATAGSRSDTTPTSDADAGTEEPPADAGMKPSTPDAGDAKPPLASGPAPSNVSMWAGKGPFGSRVVNNSGPDGKFTLFVPEPLAGNGTKNPIVNWGNGSLTTPSSYRELLSHYASYGFFVVASNNTNVGSGQEMIAGMRWAIAENARSGSPYFGKLDPDAVGSIGYSQGGIGAVITGNEPEVKTTVPIAGGDETVVNIKHPIFLVGNENDTAAPIDVISPQFTSEDTTGPFVFGILLGASHLETLGNGGRHRGYTTAWLAYHLLGDKQAYRVFYGDEKCTLCVDRAWETKRKNLP